MAHTEQKEHEAMTTSKAILQLLVVNESELLTV